jgi:hypothetical protein
MSGGATSACVRHVTGQLTGCNGILPYLRGLLSARC